MAETLTGESQKLSDLLSDPAVVIVACLTKTPIPEDAAPLLLADIVECDFAGYAAWPIMDWWIPEGDDVNLAEAVSEPIQFIAGDALVPQSAQGIFLKIKRGADAFTLWQVSRFDSPFAFDIPGRVLELQARVDSYDETVFIP